MAGTYYDTNKQYQAWLQKCIRYGYGFVPFSEKHNCWLGMDGNLIIKRQDAESYAKKINDFIQDKSQ